MNEKQKDTNSSAQQKLKEETTQLLSAVEEAEKELSDTGRVTKGKWGKCSSGPVDSKGDRQLKGGQQ